MSIIGYNWIENKLTFLVNSTHVLNMYMPPGMFDSDLFYGAMLLGPNLVKRVIDLLLHISRTKTCQIVSMRI